MKLNEPEFPGDTNETLKDIQADRSDEMVGWLFSAARERYLKAAAVLDTRTELSERLAEMRSCRPFTLRLAHDAIADYYRFARNDGGQLRVGEDVRTYETRLHDSWIQFFRGEVERFMEVSHFTRYIVTAAVFCGEETGVAAKKRLQRFLEERYSDLFYNSASD